MFAEKFDALMNIAEISNSQLGRDINMNSSHIGRLRSGARPLPKKHEFLGSICRYIAGHIRKEYQINALQMLTGINSTNLESTESTSLHLEYWLTNDDGNDLDKSGRLTSGMTKTGMIDSSLNQKYATYLYGNAGKRKGVEQFFTMILQEEKPQTLLLFSDENMAWLYEDSAFSIKWAELFKKVIMKGNHVKIIHTVSRDMNEMIEAVKKWIPIYMTGMIEPYCYPKLRDGIFKRTLFIAPNTAAIVSSSVQENTEGMLNLFITDKVALSALTKEYEQYFSLCRPLINIYTAKDTIKLQKITESIINTDGNAYYSSANLPLFALPEKTVRELSEENKDETIYSKWQKDFSQFKKNIIKQNLTLVLLDPQYINSDKLNIHTGKFLSNSYITCTRNQYEEHLSNLIEMEKKYDNLKLCFIKQVLDNTELYIKEDMGVIVIKSGTPNIAFYVNERNMVNAFWDYVEKAQS